MEEKERDHRRKIGSRFHSLGKLFRDNIRVYLLLYITYSWRKAKFLDCAVSYCAQIRNHQEGIGRLLNGNPVRHGGDQSVVVLLYQKNNKIIKDGLIFCVQVGSSSVIYRINVSVVLAIISVLSHYRLLQSIASTSQFLTSTKTLLR